MAERIQDRIKRIKTENYNRLNKNQVSEQGVQHEIQSNVQGITQTNTQGVTQEITGCFTDGNMESNRLIKRKRKPTSSYVRLQAILATHDLKKYDED